MYFMFLNTSSSLQISLFMKWTFEMKTWLAQWRRRSICQVAYELFILHGVFEWYGIWILKWADWLLRFGTLCFVSSNFTNISSSKHTGMVAIIYTRQTVKINATMMISWYGHVYRGNPPVTWFIDWVFNIISYWERPYTHTPTQPTNHTLAHTLPQ